MTSIQAELWGEKEVVDSASLPSRGGEDDEKEPLLGDASERRRKEKEAEAEEEEEDLRIRPSSPSGNKKKKRQRWNSIYVMYFTMFLSAITFSIVLSSLWPYLRVVDSVLAKSSFLGWIVAAYSFGQLVASPLFGLCADYMPTIVPLVVSLLISIVFNVFYCYAGAFGPGSAGWVLVVTRALIGFGAGIAAVVRSYVSEATTREERTSAMAGISASQALGFIMGPALGLACVPLGHSGLEIKAINFELNMYTGPGYIGALLGVANLLLLALLFRENRISTPERERRRNRGWGGQGVNRGRWKMKKIFGALLRRRRSTEATPSSELHVSTGLGPEAHPPLTSMPHYDRLAAYVSIVLFFFILFVLAVFETIALPLTMDEFAWSNKQAVLYNNIFFAGLAVVAIATFVVVKLVSKRVDERIVFMVALFLISFGFFAILPMSNSYPDIVMKALQSATSSNATNGSGDITTGTVGCVESWCTDVHEIYLYQYILCMLMIAIGYSASSLLCYSIFSKILGPFPQGTMMGVLTAAGSLARFLGPIFVSNLYHSQGPLITFAAVNGIVGVSIVVLLVFSWRLVPYKY